MTRNTIVLGALCALASACGGGGAGDPSARAATTGGGERAEVSEGSVPDLAQPSRDEARSIAGIPRTGTGIVHDADDASPETPLPSMDDPLDLQVREPIAEDVMVQICPAELRGLAVREVDLPRGAALELTAQEDAVDDLRARMQRFARALEARATEGAAERDEDDLFAGTDVRLVMIPDGARLEAEVQDEARLTELRDGLREDAATLEQGRCPLSLQVEA